MPLFNRAVYTIITNEARWQADRGDVPSAPITERKPRMSASKLFTAAKAAGADIPIVFADAADCSELIVPEKVVEETVEDPRYAVISVRPDWTDNRGLLGYYNPILTPRSPLAVAVPHAMAAGPVASGDGRGLVPEEHPDLRVALG